MYNPATYEEDMEAIRKSNKVSDEDLQSLAKYIMLAKLSGNNVTGKSYDDIIDKIKSFQQNNDELNNRVAIGKEAKRKRLSPFLEVNLQNKTFAKKNNIDVLVFIVILKNTGPQKIKTVTGNLTINDLMEKPIKNLSILLDEDIAPGQTLTKTYTIDYNDADENDRRMRSNDFFDVRIMWNPEKIIFENGKLAE
jgi:inorganic pyrophosphatase/exopolyphosphatase